MEKEVIKWLHKQMGYNASADSSLSANCRGNLKTLWEFLMTRHMAPENKRRIQQALAKHRREQEAARRAPEREQEALQQKRHLQQLEQTAATMHRTLASLQVVMVNKKGCCRLEWRQHSDAARHAAPCQGLLWHAHQSGFHCMAARCAGSCDSQHPGHC